MSDCLMWHVDSGFIVARKVLQLPSIPIITMSSSENVCVKKGIWTICVFNSTILRVRYVPHSQRYNRSFALCALTSGIQPKRRCQLSAFQLRILFYFIFFMGTILKENRNSSQCDKTNDRNREINIDFSAKKALTNENVKKKKLVGR